VTGDSGFWSPLPHSRTLGGSGSILNHLPDERRQLLDPRALPRDRSSLSGIQLQVPGFLSGKVDLFFNQGGFGNLRGRESILRLSLFPESTSVVLSGSLAYAVTQEPERQNQEYWKWNLLATWVF